MSSVTGLMSAWDLSQHKLAQPVPRLSPMSQLLVPITLNTEHCLLKQVTLFTATCPSVCKSIVTDKLSQKLTLTFIRNELL